LAACPACGEPVTAGKRFCRACGTALPGAPSAGQGTGAAVTGGGQAPAAAPGQDRIAERRVCSVLFCDVVGFTPLSESRDPEAVRELLSRYFEVARTVIGRYGGVVEKFIGDAVMAVWGAPVAAEGDTERAVRAAMDLITEVAELGAEAGVPGLAARAGVVTGEVAVTLGAVGEGMVAGDVVNTAARVQSVAQPGQVMVDAATQRLAADGVGFAAAGEHALKGKTELVPLWRATRVLSGVGGQQRIDGLEAELVGRDAELRTIKELFHAVAERRVPRLVLVSGPAGVGKSRLGWEFYKYIDGLAETVLWHRGRCLSYGDGVAFWALAEIIRQRLGIAEDDPADVATAKLLAGLNEFVPDAGEREYAGLRLGRLLGVAVAGDGGEPMPREELFAGWRLFFERLAGQDPVVLLVEDAQYADAGLLDFFDYLVDWARDLPIYVLVFARPELGAARPRFGAGRNRSTLTLDPLDRASMDRLVDGLVPGMPPSARRAVISQAQGTPLFAVETVRALIDRDIVQPVEGVYRLVGDVGELAVPDSLHALLAARLDALDPEVRQLVTDAAVLGATFPAEALIAVSGRDEREVRAALDELVHREVLSVSADPLSPQRGSYEFAQQMLRQVGYDTLSRRDRKTRHLAVAAYLRVAFAGDGEEVTDVIARHYLDALNAIPEDPDAAGIRAEAIAALVRAAERAERTGAPAMASTSYGTAAELTEEDGTAEAAAGPSAGTLWERAAQAASTSGNWGTAVDQAGRARDYYLAHHAPRAAARAQAMAGETLQFWGRVAEARDQLTSAVAVLRENPDTDTVDALVKLAGVEVFAGEPEGDPLSAEALLLGQALGVRPRQLCDLFLTRGIALGMAERRPESIAYLRESARLATKVGDTFLVGRALLNLADSLAVADPEAAGEAARTAAEHLRRAGAHDHLSFAVGNLIQALMMTGDWAAAETVLSRAIESDGLSDMMSCFKGWLAALRGDPATADAEIAGLRDMRASEMPQDQATVLTLQAFAAAARGQQENSLHNARAVIELASSIGVSHELIRWAWPLAARAAHELRDTATIQGLLAQLDGYPPGYLAPMLRAERDLVRARQADGVADAATASALSDAVRGLRELSTPYHLAHGLLDHAQYLNGQADGEAAEQAIAEARGIADRLGCQPLLDRAAGIAPAPPRQRA
jgi:class 3 adenylate cyclase/tetratricopeptide (TPR) repeat protein